MAVTKVVRVRMYEVGFGDCLLIRFPHGEHVLVDCGSMAGGETLEPVVRDVMEQTDNHLNVVVASHRHSDHINGFSAYDTLWNSVQVDEVWLPWTENPQDAAASRLRRRQDGIARSLTSLGSGSVAALAANSITDEPAIDVLLDGFAGEPRRLFLSSRDREMYSRALTGVHIQVIGPAQTEESLKRLDVECSLAALGVEATVKSSGPFAKRLQLDPRVARRLFREEIRRSPLLEAADVGDGAPVGFWLDKAVNNTSLMLLLRYGGAHLLLPGDAVGEAWVPFQEYPELAGELREVDLMKVSHHGSHNGTPRRILGDMKKVYSLLSTRDDVCPEIPCTSLLKELAALGPVVRSDRRSRLKGVKRGPFWLDVELAC